jgi:hypothetical protein
MAVASAVAAFFTAGGSEIEVVSFNYALSRTIDMKGRPSSVTQGGVITVELASSAEDADLAEWLANSYLEKDGTIRLVDQDQSTLKTVDFSKGRCVTYAERFDKAPAQGTVQRPAATFTLTISAEKIQFAGAEHDNNWSDKV